MIIGLLRRRWLVLIVCVLAGLGGAALQTHATTKVYKSSARVFVNIPAAQSTEQALQGTQLSSQLIESYAEIATSHTAAERIEASLHLPYTASKIKQELSATFQPETLIITISASDENPTRAAQLAETAASVLNETVSSLQQGQTHDTSQASIIDDAVVPTSPSSPRPTRNLVLGGLLGILVGVALALLVEALDRRVRNKAEVERLLRAPSLAAVAKIRGAGSHVMGTDGFPGSAAEAYRTLRTALRFVEPDDPLRSIVVTSPSAEDGKSTTAVNLALTLAAAGERVILVDADLRQAAVATLLGIEGKVGLTDVFSGDASLQDALQPYRDNLRVLPAGALPPNPSEILGSIRMTTLLEEMIAMSHIVVFDAPPVLPVTDAVVLSSQVDGTILVVRHGRTNRTQLTETHHRLSTVEADLVGFVYNRQPGREVAAEYGRYVASAAT